MATRAPPRPTGGNTSRPRRLRDELRELTLRLHFYVGLFIAPFLLVAAATGILYALTPQIEQVVYDKELHASAPAGQQRWCHWRSRSRPRVRPRTVPAHGTSQRDVTLGEDFGEDGIIYGGWITLSGAEDDMVVPFAGLSGDYQALPVLDEGGLGRPPSGSPTATTGVLLDPEGTHLHDGGR